MNIITNDKVKLEQAVIRLKNVMDPEIGLNVVDLGLIYHVDFDHVDKVIYCAMTLTTQFCPIGESIADGVSNVLEQYFKDYNIDVKVIFDPPWNSQLISEEGREFLNR